MNMETIQKMWAVGARQTHVMGVASSFAPLGLGLLALNFFGRAFFWPEASPLAMIVIMATLVAAVCVFTRTSFTLPPLRLPSRFDPVSIQVRSGLIRPNPT
jgi:hypothetical protein